MTGKFLAINTAGPSVEVVLYSGAYFRDTDNRNASAALMPAVDALLAQECGGLSALDFLACVAGPGSFTGIRIGVSAVRAACYAAHKKALALNYHQVLAYTKRADGCSAVLCVTDGANGTAYVSQYDGDRKQVKPCVCVPQAEAITAARVFAGAVCVDEKTALLLPEAFAPETDCEALLRAARAQAANAGDWSQVVPLYVRESQAERELRQKQHV